MNEFVTVRELVTALKLEVIQASETGLDKRITSSEVSRPGIELTGYLEYYPEDRIQLFGLKENTYAKAQTPQEFANIMKQLARPSVPCFVLSRNLEPTESLLEAAKAADVPILRSALMTGRIISAITTFVDKKLAKRDSVHGVFVDVYGLGVLIQGESGIGKSEIALELVKNGHRLIADDRVDVYQQDEITLYGEAPELLQNMLELRGVGIIDVQMLFGATAIKTESKVQLIINLQKIESGQTFDRLGNAEEHVELAGVLIPKISVPVSVGRNVSTIIEAAAANYRSKLLGRDSAKEFIARLNRLIKNNSDEDGK
ncbi:MAG: HPr(Ser) kinase/phosphatase [Lactobacillales bacterium]|jgi:HPr kinase/phosphorylase|nr:HPr(Ser) kinase/phosphatase [Lactobacillales bacterium]